MANNKRPEKSLCRCGHIGDAPGTDHIERYVGYVARATGNDERRAILERLVADSSSGAGIPRSVVQQCCRETRQVLACLRVVRVAVRVLGHNGLWEVLDALVLALAATGNRLGKAGAEPEAKEPERSPGLIDPNSRCECGHLAVDHGFDCRGHCADCETCHKFERATPTGQEPEV